MTSGAVRSLVESSVIWINGLLRQGDKSIDVLGGAMLYPVFICANSELAKPL
jgi:hypothetical protein